MALSTLLIPNGRFSDIMLEMLPLLLFALNGLLAAADEEVLVERVVWPVLLEPERCRDMPVEQIEITENGQPCRVTAVESQQPPRVHALLLDNSGSMGPFMGNLEKSAVEYIKRAPESERVIVTSFANNVLLEAGLAADRAQQIAAVRDLVLGHRTALLDALYYMMRYLQSRPERKVLIVFTDTFDNDSLGRHDPAQLLELARSIPDLSVFTIHFRRDRHQYPNATQLLKSLAHETGGGYYVARQGRSFRKAFRAIRTRLDGEAFATYIPPPGDGAWREVRVQAQEGSGCRARSAGPSARRSGPPLDPEPTLVPIERTRDDAPGTVAWRVPRPPSWSRDGGQPTVLYTFDPRQRLFGRTLEIVEERGDRYDAGLLARTGHYRLRTKEPASFAARSFAVDLPPIDLVLDRIHGPVDVLEHMLTLDEAPLVHGQTLLELRRALAQAIFLARDDYRSWAQVRLEQLHEARVDELMNRFPDTGQIPDLRRRLREETDRPGSEASHAFLTEWLGDLSAHELVLELQRGRINDALHGATREAGPAIEPAWDRLLQWFPPPARIRVVALLVPAYDKHRDVVGFYRVVLPRLKRFGPPLDPVPERPFAWRAVDRLLQLPELAEALRDHTEAINVSLRPLERSDEPPRSTNRSGHPPHEAFESHVQLSLDGRKTFSLRSIHVRQGHATRAFELRCLELEGPPGTALFEQIRKSLANQQLDCDPLDELYVDAM